MKSNADQDVKQSTYVVNMSEQPCCKSRNIFWRN